MPAFAVVAGLFLTVVMLGVVQNEGYAINSSATQAANGTQVSTDLPENTPSLAPTNNASSSNEATSLRHSEGIKVYGKDYPAELKGIDWGTITIGRISYYHIYVTNTGNHPVTLNLSVNNWTSGVNGKVDWDYSNKEVPINSTVSINLSLKISSASVNTFNNDIVITSNSR